MNRRLLISSLSLLSLTGACAQDAPESPLIGGEPPIEGCENGCEEEEEEPRPEDLPDMSYQKILDPIVDRLAQGNRFGQELAQAYQSVTDFAKTDQAKRFCADSAQNWGLEVSFGGNIGIGYQQGLEILIEEDELAVSCLNQVNLATAIRAGGQLNLVRHFGACESEEGPEETLFAEVGVGAGLSLGITAGVGVAYTAGLRDGLVNRALPSFAVDTYDNFLEMSSAALRGDPVITPIEDREKQAALCATMKSHFENEANRFPVQPGVRSEIIGEFVEEYLKTNTACYDDLKVLRPANDEDWTACTDATLKGAITWFRAGISDNKATATGVLDRWAFTQIDTTFRLVDDIFSGCDHVEFQLNAGIGAQGLISLNAGLESHSHYGTITFDGEDEELGELLADSFDGVAGKQRECDPPGIVYYIPFLKTQTYCDVTDVIKGSFEFAQAITSDSRFDFQAAQSVDWFGYYIPLPDDPLVNYAVTCSLGPMKNVFDFVWDAE